MEDQPSPSNPQPALTKSELATLDFVIADAIEKGEPLTLDSSAGFTRMIMRDAAKELVKQLVKRIVRGGPQTETGTPIDERKVREAMDDVASEEVTLDDLIAFRKKFEG
ncbi:hypothetical protein E4631_25125 [Hymenobacter sp. UV11]|uniref:hypothetical protein n=1 Tax=Hymenobacter sp. UV11 TaxID=1849735 RepID=UPI00105C39B7|nr:hypothetical protein [Hymenobacter sp. UV11]TFZ62441.1 hypothetical protein E4631_25125 [Hymenobacter sp. UV11]